MLLPNEVWLEIFRYMTEKEKWKFARVDKNFRNLLLFMSNNNKKDTPLRLMGSYEQYYNEYMRQFYYIRFSNSTEGIKEMKEFLRTNKDIQLYYKHHMLKDEHLKTFLHLNYLIKLEEFI